MKRFSPKKIVVAGALTAGIVFSGIGFAAWTATGTGQGAVAASSASDASVTASAGTANGDLWPGGPAVELSFTVDNPNPYPVEYTTFNSAEITDVQGGSDGNAAACTVDDFTLISTDGDLAAAVDVDPNGTAQAGSTSAILQMLDTASDNCQGAVVTVGLKVAGTQTTTQN